MNSNLGQLMILLFECASVDQKDANNLPTEKVVRLEMFGGLNFVSLAYYDFVLRLEYVFVKSLTSVKLAVLGDNLIDKVCNYLGESGEIRYCVQDILSYDADVTDTSDDDT